MRRLTLILLAAALGPSVTLAGDTLSLEDYLGQVRKDGFSYRSASDAVEGLAKQKVQTDLLYSPQVVAHAVRVDDRQQQLVPELYGNRTVNDDYGVALVKKWRYGATTSLDYGWNRTEVDGSSFLPDTVAYQVHPSASVTLSLWRDFLGQQTRAQMDHNKFQIESGEYMAAHKREGVLYQARLAYWNLQLSRVETLIRKDTLARAATLVGWSERRVRLRLADDSEALQARAGQKVRELELEQSLERERDARTAFNRLRGMDGDAVAEDLTDLESQAAGLGFDWPTKAPERWDVRGAEAQIKADKAAWKDAKSNQWPDLNAFAAWRSNGLDPQFDPAHAESAKGHYPTSTVGASVVIPLDVFTASKAAEGYEKNYRSSKEMYQDKLLETRQQWQNLASRLADVNRRLDMASEIEAIQKKKAEKERERLSLGRTTQFQVQSFETDYALSRLQRLSMVAEKLSLWAEGEWMLSADREKPNK